MDTETFSLPQVLPLDFSKCHSHRETFSSVLPSIASLSFQTKLHTLPQEVSPTHPCPRGLVSTNILTTHSGGFLGTAVSPCGGQELSFLCWPKSSPIGRLHLPTRPGTPQRKGHVPLVRTRAPQGQRLLFSIRLGIFEDKDRFPTRPDSP